MIDTNNNISSNRALRWLQGFNPLCVAIALSLLMLAAIIALKGLVYNADTPSYIGAWNGCTRHGDIDTFRTPLYPAVIGLGRLIFGQAHWALFPLLLQTVVFYACGIPFSRMIRSVISNRRVGWFTIFLYFLFYPIVNTLNLLGTEALAFSLTSLWTYCVWRFLQRARLGYGIAIALLTLAEIMLRPSLLILAMAIVGLAVAGVFMKKYRRQVLWLLLTLIPTGVVYKLYVDEMESRTGVSTISTVSIVNNYYMAREFNDIYPELLADNPEALRVMQSHRKEGDRLSEQYILMQYTEFDILVDSCIMNYSDIDRYAARVKHEHPDVWYSNIMKRIVDSFHAQGPVKNICNDLVVMLYTIAFVAIWIVRRRFSLVNFLILMLGGGSLLSVLLYAQNDFGRLMLPTSAILILMGGQLIDYTVNFLRNKLPRKL
ncbi:MAG: hypothetical protein HDS77_02170 [Bacteroidales bacterium]|nr:hypothetical protein [Bacteroidales bacterium]